MFLVCPKIGTAVAEKEHFGVAPYYCLLKVYIVVFCWSNVCTEISTLLAMFF